MVLSGLSPQTSSLQGDPHASLQLGVSVNWGVLTKGVEVSFKWFGVPVGLKEGRFGVDMIIWLLL